MRGREPAGGQLGGLNGARLAGGGTISAGGFRALELRGRRHRSRSLWDVAKVVAFTALFVTVVVTLWR